MQTWPDWECACALFSWKEAEQDLANAVTIAGQDPRMEPASLRRLLIDYAAVLRKTHRPRDARAVETRIAALARVSAWVVDVSELVRSDPTNVGNAR